MSAPITKAKYHCFRVLQADAKKVNLLLCLVLAAVYDDWMRVVQIYSGHMERKFVPVEKRGKGEADDDSKAPAESHPQSTGPHSANSDSIPTNGEHALCLVSWHTVQLLQTGWYQRRHVVQSSYLT
jgi:hypothetical protein